MVRAAQQIREATLNYLPFNGGLDQVTPPLNVKPGFVRESQNYEIGVNGGYKGIGCYERFDGQASPSDAVYSLLYVEITGSFSVGDTITGATSGATAVVLKVITDVPEHLIVTKISGTFTNEDLNVSGSPEGKIGTYYQTKTLDLSSGGASSSTVTFNDDGTSMYLSGVATPKVFQYTLSTAWDITTATLANTLDLTSTGFWVRAVKFNTDGTIMFVLNDAGVTDSVNQYTLTTAWDISTATSASKSFSTASESTDTFDLAFKTDGSKFYTLQNSSATIYQYSLSIPYDFSSSSPSYDSVSLDVSSEESSPAGMFFSSSGLTLFVFGGQEKVFQYDLTTAWDISTATYSTVSFDASAQVTGTGGGISFGNSGFNMYLYDINSDDLFQYSVASPYSILSSLANSGASTNLLHAQYANLAADEYRDDISTVPGSGDVLGVWMLNDVKYAFRNNIAGTQAVMHKATASGWSEIDLGREVSFTSGGTYEILEGDTITGATSTATAVVKRVILTSGTWAGGDAAGRLILASQLGTFQSENLDVGANLNVATIAANSTAITLSPSGSYECINHNFGGDDGTMRMYGCDGVNKGFEFDGTVFVPIETGMTTDTPTHVAEHKNHLFFSFAGSAQHSGIGTPYSWSLLSGASELAVGDTITGFQTETGSESNAALGIYSRNRVHILYGTSSSDWNLVKYRDEVGAYAKSIQQVGSTIMMDDRGVVTLRTSQAFGNFKHATVSELIQPFLNDRKSTINASCISRDKSQYRIYFNDDSGLHITVGKKGILGMMPVALKHKVKCMFSLEATDGSEVIMFGSDDGYVYQMEKGTSFDGDSVERYLVMHFHHSKMPRINKAYKGCSMEIQGSGYADYDFSYELGYNSTLIPQASAANQVLPLSHARWDSFYWDSFYWDGRALEPSELELNGSAENISLVIRSDSDYHSPMTFTGAVLRYIPRKVLR